MDDRRQAADLLGRDHRSVSDVLTHSSGKRCACGAAAPPRGHGGRGNRRERRAQRVAKNSGSRFRSSTTSSRRGMWLNRQGHPRGARKTTFFSFSVVAGARQSGGELCDTANLASHPSAHERQSREISAFVGARCDDPPPDTASTNAPAVRRGLSGRRGLGSCGSARDARRQYTVHASRADRVLAAARLGRRCIGVEGRMHDITGRTRAVVGAFRESSSGGQSRIGCCHSWASRWM